MAEVFICYASQDRECVFQIVDHLEAAGVQVWIDRHGIGGGASYGPQIVQAIKGCKVLMLICSAASVRSRNVRQEIQLAWRYERPYLPLLLETVSFPEQIQYWLEGCQWIEVFDMPPERWLPEVLDALAQAGVASLLGSRRQAPGARPDEMDARRLAVRPPSEPGAWSLAPGAASEASPDVPPAFIVGPPITHPSRFFGRERELKRLFGLWRQLPLQNAAIIGPRRSGKTSLLLYLASIACASREHLRPGQRSDWLPALAGDRRPERYHWIFVDFQDPRLGTRDGLLRCLLAQLGLPVPDRCELDDFLDVVSRQLRSPTIILLDEIGVALQRYRELDDSFWEGLRSLATNQVGGNLAFVVASHEPPDQLARHTQLGSPFFNIFGYTATMGPLTEPEARELIATSSVPFHPADADWILAQSGRWPILLQVLCRERLITLEAGETDDLWREDGLQQMTPFRHLLEAP